MKSVTGTSHPPTSPPSHLFPVLPVYPAIVVREGQPLSIDCSTGDPIVDANYLEVFRGGEPPPRTTFASASLGESGTFQCALFGVTSDLVVRVIPGQLVCNRDCVTDIVLFYA